MIMAMVLACVGGLSVGSDTIVPRTVALRPPRAGIDTTDTFVTRDSVRRQLSLGTQSVAKIATGFVIVQVNGSGANVAIDSSIVDSTWTPIRHVEAFRQRHSVFEFRRGRAVGTVEDSSGKHTVNVPAAAFDFSIITSVTNALPLAVGYAVHLRTYDVNEEREKVVGFKVIKREAIDWKSRKVDAWVTETDFGTHMVTRWTEVATGRDLRRLLTFKGMVMDAITRP